MNYVSPVIENWSPTMQSALRQYMYFKEEVNRVLTCFDLEGCDWIDAVQDGFCMKADGDFQCFCCGLIISPTMLRDCKQLHRSFNSDCSFVLQREPNLLARTGVDGVTTFSNPMVPSELGIKYEPVLVSSLVHTDTGEIIQLFSEMETINPETAFRVFQHRINRAFSYKDAPISQDAKNVLVEAGFFWTGYSKTIQCAFCRMAISGNVKMHPLIVHAQMSPNCPFIRNEKYEVERNSCCICLLKDNKVLYLPCKHLAVCLDCDIQMVQHGGKNCPICRRAIESKIVVIKP